MKTFSYTITDEVGIHARPAGLLAKKAKEFVFVQNSLLVAVFLYSWQLNVLGRI